MLNGVWRCGATNTHLPFESNVYVNIGIVCEKLGLERGF